MSTAVLPLPLSLLCFVSVTASRQGAVAPSFNQALLISDDGIIPTVGPNSRLRPYPSVAAIIADGFDPDSLVVQGAGLYFGKTLTPAPQILWIGAQDPSALAAVAIGAAPGTDYDVDDIVTVTHAGAQLGLVKVTAVSEGGIPTAVALIQGSQGTGYTVSNNNATTGGAGTGLEINVTAIGETVLQALTACRLASPAWYLAGSTTATDSDNLACIEFAQTATPQMQWCAPGTSNAIISGAAGNMLSTAKAANYGRGHVSVTTTQGGSAPLNALIQAAVMGLAMGLNTGLASSQFTLMGKPLEGIIPDPWTVSQINTISGLPLSGTTGNNGNIYGNYANTYSVYQQGINTNGTWFDQVLGLDMLAADAQISIVNLLATLPSIPQDDDGQTLVLNAASGACTRAATRGFLAKNLVYNGPTILGLKAGTPLPSGFFVQSPPASTQSQADRDARKGMPVYITVILAGSQQSFTIGINVQE